MDFYIGQKFIWNSTGSIGTVVSLISSNGVKIDWEDLGIVINSAIAIRGFINTKYITLLDQPNKNTRVKHIKTNKLGTCLGTLPENKDWFEVKWDDQRETYNYTIDDLEFV